MTPADLQAEPSTQRQTTLGLLIVLEEVLLSILLTTIIVLACYQIGLRWFTQGGLVWIDPLLRYLVLWGGLLGAVLATAKDNHISMDVIGYLLGERAGLWLKLIIAVFSTIISVFLVRATLLFIRSEYEFGGAGLFGIPTWGWNLIFPLAFTAICLHFLINAGSAAASLFTGRRQSDE